MQYNDASKRVQALSHAAAQRCSRAGWPRPQWFVCRENCLLGVLASSSSVATCSDLVLAVKPSAANTMPVQCDELERDSSHTSTALPHFPRICAVCSGAARLLRQAAGSKATNPLVPARELEAVFKGTGLETESCSVTKISTSCKMALIELFQLRDYRMAKKAFLVA